MHNMCIFMHVHDTNGTTTHHGGCNYDAIWYKSAKQHIQLQVTAQVLAVYALFLLGSVSASFVSRVSRLYVCLGCTTGQLEDFLDRGHGGMVRNGQCEVCQRGER